MKKKKKKAHTLRGTWFSKSLGANEAITFPLTWWLKLCFCNNRFSESVQKCKVIMEIPFSLSVVFFFFRSQKPTSTPASSTSSPTATGTRGENFTSSDCRHAHLGHCIHVLIEALSPSHTLREACHCTRKTDKQTVVCRRRKKKKQIYSMLYLQ